MQHIVTGAQIDRVQPPGGQRLLHEGGLCAVPHQDGDVPRGHDLTIHLCARQQPQDFTGRPLGQRFSPLFCIAAALAAEPFHLLLHRQQPPLEGRPPCRSADRLPIRPAGTDRRVLDAIAEDPVVGNGLAWIPGYGVTVEEPVIAPDHFRRRAVVGAHHPLVIRVITGGEIGEDIPAPETIDGLLGVADHAQHPALLPGLTVDPLEDGVLVRVRVLEFVHQRHRELLTQALSQGGSTFGRGQLVAQTADQVAEIQLIQPVLAGGQVLPREGHAPPGPPGLARPLEPRHATGKLVQRRHGLLFLLAAERLLQELPLENVRDTAVPGQAAQALKLLLHGLPAGLGISRFPGPDIQCRERLPLLRPLATESLPGGLQVRYLGFRKRFCALDRAFPDLREGLGRGLVGVQLLEVWPLCLLPVPVLQCLAHQVAAVHFHGRLKTDAAGEGFLGKRPPAEAVDGIDGRLIHVQGGIAQARPDPGGVREAFPERQVEGLFERLPMIMGALDLAGQAPLEFGGGSPGEGHHQQLLHVQLPLQKQAQVQARDIESLAGAGTGLDQVNAFQRQMGDVQFLHHTASVVSVIVRAVIRSP